ncbi:divalent anion symporter [Sulfurimonas gotlandica GD1]|uniref:Divalent anion symporter n=1 Tax=Sulfurimonas gotlandica (strain DSM 19862 / JCM 16533 / GD1) TaxID=929558 RepID=B6BM92_SULGG|nr:sodium:proton antiporter NhaD [Sulfurimonas gotlandica]EDZ61874.1 Na+/H+ antiporter [Sulfurimonas gotlandica GD1]EHP29330.1 divalent anion symporter [Sulfurimonas gotlandica GD1]
MTRVEGGAQAIDLAVEPFGWLLLVIFIVGYYFIAAEEKYHINKAKPALFTGTFMFMLLGGYYAVNGLDFSSFDVEIAHLILEIAEIFFFLFVAMTFIEALIERNVFDALKEKLLSSGYDYKKLFWVTGFLAFFISPVADNLTTALILSTVLITIERKNKAFLVPAAINIVVAANAGGAWSPFGDITTLMAWSAGKGTFIDFLFLFPSSILGWGVTAFLLSRFVPDGTPTKIEGAEPVHIHKGGKVIIFLGVLTIASAVLGKQLMHLPPMWGMLFGLSLLQLYAYTLKKYHDHDIQIYKSVAKVENDTLLFFFGILAAVGALHFAGFLAHAAHLYTMFDPTYVNIGVGFLSAIVDNVPVMSAVLKASPDIPLAQWMLVTLTAGVGGSMISFGSAAGVGVMGKLKGVYTFGAHMKYSWTIVAGYFVSVAIWYTQYEVLGLYIKPVAKAVTGH